MNTTLKLFPGVAAALVALTACPPPPPPEPVVPKAATVKAFSAAPATIDVGGEATLSWEVQDATSVSITMPDGSPVPVADPKAATGSVHVAPQKSTVYLLTARGEGGEDTAATSVMVSPEPGELLFAAAPAKISAGEHATIIWSAPQATKVTITDGSGAPVHTSFDAAGSVEVSPSMTTTYTLTADDRTATATLEVSPAILAFQANPPAGAPGQPVTFSWKVAGAESVTLSAEGRGELQSFTDPAQIADGSVQDTIPTTIPVDGLVRYTLTARQGTQTAVQTLTVYAGVDPLFTDVTVPQFGKRNGVYTVSWATLNASAVRVLVDGVVVHVTTTKAEVSAGLTTLVTPATSATVAVVATNDRGGRTERSSILMPVDPPAFVSFGVTPGTIANGGDPVTLSWEVTNARHVVITTDDGTIVAEQWGTSAESASLQLYPNKPTVYTLEADNTVGESIMPMQSTADVTSPVTMVFSPARIVPDGASLEVTGTTLQGGGPVRAVNFGQKNMPGTAFIDISGTGAQLPVLEDQDTVAYLATFPEPFTTRVMGSPVTATSASININGWLVFTKLPINGPAVPSTTLPSDKLPPLTIAAFMDDLESGPDTRIYWQLEGTGSAQRLIVQWEHVYEFPYTQSPEKWVSFQVQLYSTGEMVTAFKDVIGYTSSDIGVIGQQNATATAGVAVSPSLFANGKNPEAGDIYSLFAPVTFPLQLTVTPTTSLVLSQQVGNGEIEIADQPTVLPPYDFAISEVNYAPAAGKEQWFEVQNYTSSPVELAGWTIDFGDGNVHQIAAPSLILPANGRLLFGQSADSAEASAGGPAIDYVYGTGFTMPDATGSVTLSLAGAAYSTAAWTTAGTVGTSTVFEIPNPAMKYRSGTKALTCDSKGTYGSATQVGSPGQPNNHCFPYALSSIPGAFQPIAGIGTGVGGLVGVSTTNVTVAFNLARPIPYMGQSVSTLRICSNGWLSTVPTTSTSSSNKSTPSSTAPTSLLAPFWDYMKGNGTGSGVYVLQADPDAIPGSGDEYTIVSWENWRFSSYTSSLNFQVKILEATGDIEFHFGDMTCSSMPSYAKGSSATTWIDNEAGTAALPANINSSTSPGILPDSGYLFTYTP